ncbi:MAG: hypothetical protein QE487_03670 [Fluviicola sp.]|nr:hypothetical protein [Fluviicola sp.]
MYQQRKISPYAPIQKGDFFWKRYTISANENVQLNELIKSAESLTNDLLFSGEAKPMYNTGFIIIHAGLDVNFVVFGYWVNKNELMTKVYKSLPSESHLLLPVDLNTASGLCIWDLSVVFYEKEALIQYLLDGALLDIEAYRLDQLDNWV